MIVRLKPAMPKVPRESRCARREDRSRAETRVRKPSWSSTDMKPPIYLDYNATTPVDERVLTRMLPYFTERFGNAASRDHPFGWDAAEAIEEARDQVADLINAQPREIVFTGGATDSISRALQKVTSLRKPCRLITCLTEHDAVLETCRALEMTGEVKIDYLPVDCSGRIHSEMLSASLELEAAVLAIMIGNNEIGSIHPFRELVSIARARGVCVFSDITQSVGKIPVDVYAAGIDLAAFSAHKIYGPKGIGALYIRGGGQERDFTAGTLNVAGIVGFGEACRLAKRELPDEAGRIAKLRDRLEQALLACIPDVWINGNRQSRLPNTSNVGFRRVDARNLIRDMHDIAVSTRAACSSSTAGPSHVLKAIGLSDDEADWCVRFSLGRFTTEEEIDYAVEKVIASVRKIRRTAAATPSPVGVKSQFST
jgi:cysteine desulfurase